MKSVLIPRHLRRPVFAIVIYEGGALVEVVDVMVPRKTAMRLAWELDGRLPANMSAAAVPMSWHLLTKGGQAT